MRRTALAFSVIITVVLVSILISVHSVRFAVANFGPYIPPTISIQCPENGTTYTAGDVSLIFTCSNALSDWFVGSPVFTYSLDGNENVTIKGSTTLQELSYGTHGVTVYALFTTGGHVAPDPNSPHTTVTVSSYAVFSVNPPLDGTFNSVESISPELSPEELWAFTVANLTANNLSFGWRRPNVENGIAYLCNTETYIIPGEPHVPLLDIPVTHSLGTVHAINITSGEELWNLTGAGSSFYFAIVDGVAYISASSSRVTNGQSEGGRLYALDAANGTLKWSHYFNGDIHWSLINEDLIYVFFQASDSNGHHSYVCALNTSDGSQFWRWEADHYSWLSYPAVSDGTIYFSTYSERQFYALSALNGTELWRVPFEGRVSSPHSSPFSVVDGVVYFSSDEATYALNAQNGEKLWNYSVSSNDPCVVYGSVVYVSGADNTVYAFDAFNGDEVWNYSANETRISPLCIADDAIYFSFNETLNALSAADGEQLWSVSTEGQAPYTISDGSYHEYISDGTIEDGVLYYYSGETLHALDGSNGNCLWNFTSGGRRFLTVANGTAFFAAGNTVYAFTVPSVPHSSPTPTPESHDVFLTTLVAVAAGASAAIVGFGVLLYFKKRR